MKKLYIQLLVVLIACGCAKQDDIIISNNPTVGKSFNVQTEDVRQGETKAHIEGLKVIFDNEDKLAVFDKNTAVSLYTYSTENQKFSGESVATGTVINDVFALYPYSASVTCDGTKIEATLPAVQKYEEDSFSNDSHIMFGVTDNVADGITLKNMCGYIKLRLYSDDATVVKEIKLSTLEDNQVVSGDFYISKEGEESEHSLKMYAIDADGHSGQSGSVTLDCSVQNGGGVALSNDSNNPTIFYIAIPAQNYTKGFKITVTDIYGRDVTKSASAAFMLERSHIKPMAALGIDMNSVINIETDANDNAYVTADAVDNKFPIEKFLKWGYLVNYCNNELGIKLTGNVYMPQFEIEPDHENKTYKITDRPITVTDGVPSGSNWVPLGEQISSSDLSKAFKGNINGQGHKINNLCVKTNITGAGLISCFCDGIVKDLTLSNSYISNDGQAVGGIVGYCRYNSIIDNISIVNSAISGKSHIGGVVGYIYRRTKTGDEVMPYIIDCNVDNTSTIKSEETYAGGICGFNYGAALIHCTNSADVTGSTSVGGVIGYTRSYYNNGVSGYLIASGTTSDATITATSDTGYAGGIAGTSFLDGTHYKAGSDSYIVACYSNSNVIASKAGSLIGGSETGIASTTIASWAQKYDMTSYNGNHPTKINLKESNHYASANEITNDIITKMNDAIDEYNTTVKDVSDSSPIKCYYKWQYNADGWPTLIATPVSNNPE